MHRAAVLAVLLIPGPAAAETVCGDGPTVAGIPPPCGVIAAAGGEIDDGDACFRGGGPAASLRTVTDAGAGGDLIWTYTTDAVAEANYAHWTLHLAEAGSYRVEVYTAAAHARSRQARYQVRHAGEEVEVVLDQTGVDGWQPLGDLAFAAGGDQSVHLGDATGEALADGVQLAFDAVRLTRLDPPVIDEDDDGDDPDPEGGCQAGGSGGGAVILAALMLLLATRARRGV